MPFILYCELSLSEILNFLRITHLFTESFPATNFVPLQQTSNGNVDNSLVVGPFQPPQNVITVITTPLPVAESQLTSAHSVSIPSGREDGLIHSIPENDIMTFDLESMSPIKTEEIEIKPTEMQEAIDLESNITQHSENSPTDEQENISPNVDFKRKTSEELNLQKSVKKYASTEMKFRFFKINWSKISDGLLNRLSCLQDFRDRNATINVPRAIQLSKTEMNNLCNIVVDQLRLIDSKISAATMEEVAQQILQKYPGLNFVDDDGFGNGQSYVVWKHKMLNRNTYLNRFKDPDVQMPSTSDIKRNRNVKAGTIKEYWELTSKECSKDIISKLIRNEPGLLTNEFMEQSQSYVRFRLGCPDLKKTIDELPVLRRRQLLAFHFEKATGVQAGALLSYFVAKRRKIIDYSKTARKKLQLNEDASDYEILNFLFLLLGEDISDLFEHKEVIFVNKFVKINID